MSPAISDPERRSTPDPRDGRYGHPTASASSSETGRKVSGSWPKRRCYSRSPSAGRQRVRRFWRPQALLRVRAARASARSRRRPGPKMAGSCCTRSPAWFPRTSDIWALPLFGDRKPFPVAETGFNEGLRRVLARWRWIAFTTDETGQTDVYVQPFLREGGKYRISPTGGRNPRWRADSKELFYVEETEP